MDTFKAKSQKKGNRLRQQEEEEEDEEDVVDEVTLLVTDSRSVVFWIVLLNATHCGC